MLCLLSVILMKICENTCRQKLTTASLKQDTKTNQEYLIQHLFSELPLLRHKEH